MAEVFIENEGQKILDVIGEHIGSFGNFDDVSWDDEEEGIEMEPLMVDGKPVTVPDEPAEPLGDEEIEIAQQNIDDLNPLKHCKLYQLFPYLCCFMRLCKSRPGFMKSDREVLFGQHSELEQNSQDELAEGFKDDDERLNAVIKKCRGKKYEGTDYIQDSMEKFNHDEQSKSKMGEKKQDPMALYGFGVTAYFKLLSALIFVFIILSLKAAVIMYIYSSYDSSTDLDTIGGMGTLVYGLSMSKMYHAQTQCNQQFYLTGQKLSITCDSGTSSIKTPFNDVEFGFVRGEGKIMVDGEEQQIQNDYCGVQSRVFPPSANCDQHIDKAGFQQFYMQNCFNQNQCDINFEEYITDSVKGTDCGTIGTYFYIKVECELEPLAIKRNNEVAIFIVFLGIIMTLLYLLVLNYLEKVAQVDFKIWDLNTCTVADYSVELQLTEAVWQTYLHKKKNGEETRPFDKFIREEFEKFVDALPQRLDHFTGSVKIAAISFGYYDGGLINLLYQRGRWITAHDITRVNKVNDKITHLVNHKRLEISRPVSCFVTFNYQEGHDRCEYFLFKKDHGGHKNPHFQPTKFMDKQVHVKQVSESSDVIWENLHHSFMHRRKKSICVAIVILLFVFASFILFAFLKTKAGNNKLKYPSTIDCPKLIGNFKVQSSLREFASIDKEPTMQMHGSGYYQCYCQKYSSASALFDSSDGDFCDQYQQDKRTGLMLTTLVTFLVSFFNIIIRNMNMKLIDCIGYHTHSERYTAIMTSVFITSFVNTGILLLLTNANLDYTFLKFLNISNQFAGFTVSWFTNIGGSIAQTMLIQAWMPYIEITIALSIKKLLQGLDSGFPCCPRGPDKPKTKCVTNQQYINKYAGPEYMMHFRYSSIMVQVYVAFMYALFMPIIVPIALLGIFNMYCVERMALAYYYRQPPMFDEKLNQRAIDFLQGAPFLMFLTSYWAFGNRQIFFNIAPGVYEHANDVQNPYHTPFAFSVNGSFSINATQLILLVIIFFILDMFLSKYRIKWYKRIGLLHDCPPVLRADINEELPYFFKALSGVEQKIWYATELYNRAKGISQNLTDESLEQLRTQHRDGKKKYIKSMCNYDILNNISYQQKFQYQPLDERNEREDNIYSDIISSMLNINDDMTQPKQMQKRKKRMTNEKGEIQIMKMGLRKRTQKKPKRKTVASLKRINSIK